jgi:PKD repeat protein
LTRIEWSDGARSFDLTQGENTPTFKNVKEDFEINLTVTASDPDIEIGQADLLSWYVGSSGWNAYPHPTDPLKAYVTYTPTNDDAISSIVETSIYCLDVGNKQSQDDMTIRLMIENTNDAPEILTVNNEVPEVQGAIKTVSLTQETGIYALEDELFTIQVTAEDIDPRDSVEFEALNPAFQKFADPFDPFTMNFTIRPTQEMVGFHTVMIKVSDDDGETDTVTVNFEVVNTNDPPVDTFKIDWETSVELVEKNELTFFVEDLEDPDGDELTVTWDFGDNTDKVTGETVTHTYMNDQDYIITVTVSDPSGSSVSDTRTITIYEYIEPEPDPDLDTDGDGMPDVYEDDNGLNKNDPGDKTLDEDGDRFTNYDEYIAGTNPLDPKDKPLVQDNDDGGIDPLLIVIIAVVVIGILAAVGFFVFALSRKPKPVAQQQAYAPEGPGLPPGQAPQLPQQQAPGLPPAPEQEGVGSAPQEELPPVQEEPKEEENLMDSFLEDAAKQIEDDQKPSPEEENVWRPPEENTGTEQESQVDDLFAEPPEETSGPEAGTTPQEAEAPPEAPPKLSGPPPPPEI